MKNKRKFFLNALLLTAVALFMRTVGVTFQVYLAGRAGAEAMGLLSLIGGVYGFAVTLATSGIHLATVRTVAQSEEKTAARARDSVCAPAFFTHFSSGRSRPRFFSFWPLCWGIMRFGTHEPSGHSG